MWDLLPEETAKPRIKRFYSSWLKSSKFYDKYSNPQKSTHMLDSNVQPPSNMLDAPTTDCKHASNQAIETDVCETTPLLGEQVSVKERAHFEEGHATFDSWRDGSGIVWALWKSFGLFYASLGIYEAILIVLTFARPVLLE